MRKGASKLAQAVKGKKTGQARQMCDFLCLSFSGDEGISCLFPLVYPLFKSLFPCRAVYGGEEEGVPYWDWWFRSGTGKWSCKIRCQGPSGACSGIKIKDYTRAPHLLPPTRPPHLPPPNRPLSPRSLLRRLPRRRLPQRLPQQRPATRWFPRWRQLY